jgi:hypothetical protein
MELAPSRSVGLNQKIRMLILGDKISTAVCLRLQNRGRSFINPVADAFGRHDPIASHASLLDNRARPAHFIDCSFAITILQFDAAGSLRD